MSRNYRVLIAVAFLVLLAAGCQTAQEQATPTPIPTPIVAEKQTYIVQRGRVQDLMTFSARVSPVVEEELYFKVSGFVKTVNVERNDEVKAGDILAELEIESALNQLAQVQVSLEKAQLSLQAAEEANRREIAESQASLDTKKLRLAKFRTQSPKWNVEKARLNMEDAKEKLQEAQEPATELELAAARLAVTQAETSLQEAKEDLAEVKAGPTAAQLASAEAALKAAQERYAMLQAGADLEAIEQAKLNLDKARNSLWSAQANRDSTCGRVKSGGASQASCDSANANVANAEISVKLAEISYRKAQEPPSDADVADAAAQVAKLEEDLKELRNRPLPLDITKAETKVAQAEYNLRDAKDKLAELEASASELESAQADARLAKLKAATISYELAKASYESALQSQKAYEFDLQIMEEDYELAKVKHSWLEQGVDPKLHKAVEQAQLSVDRLQAQVNEGRLVAPIDGVVTTFAVYEGRKVDAHKTVAIVADFSEVELAAQLGDSEMSYLEIDMPVTVTLSSYPGQEFPGIIAELPYPYGKGGSQDKLDKADLFTHVRLNNPDIELNVGDSTKVTVLLEEAFDTLYLPPQAVRSFEGRNFVVVDVEGRQRRIDVKVGVTGEDRIEILEGVEEGQVVIGQ